MEILIMWSLYKHVFQNILVWMIIIVNWSFDMEQGHEDRMMGSHLEAV